MRPPADWSKRGSSAATAGLVFAIISICLWPLGAVALLCGIQGRHDVLHRDMTGNSQAVAAIIIGGITTAASLIAVAVLLAGAVSN